MGLPKFQLPPLHLVDYLEQLVQIGGCFNILFVGVFVAHVDIAER